MEARSVNSPLKLAVPRAVRPRAPASPRIDVGDGGDTTIRASLLARLAAQRGWLADRSNVFVQDGLVIYQGLFHRHADRLACMAVAQDIPGVRGVRDDRVRSREWQAMA